MGRDVTTAATDKRRVILDAAVRVFARQGFHTCRVSDIADEAGVAYGLVYHYFSSKEEILDTLFLERWDVMLAAIAEADASDARAAGEAVRDRRLHHRLLPPRPRADEGDHRRGHAGRQHVRAAPIWPRSARPTPGSPRSSRGAQAEGVFRTEITPEFAAQAFYGSIEQVLTGWIFDSAPVGDAELERAKTLIVETICRGLERERRRADAGGGEPGAASLIESPR